MSFVTAAPALGDFEVPMDGWTRPFWEAASRQELVMPRCSDCAKFRWPPGPFCPHCRSQAVEWLPAGPARLYSFTVLRQKGEDGERHVAPGLVEFPEAGGVRMMAPIVDTPREDIRIGAGLVLCWAPAGETNLPRFTIL